MGRGNVCVTGDFEGLYYIDNDYLDVYVRTSEDDDDCEDRAMLGELSYTALTSGDWKFHESESYWEWQSTKDYLKSRLKDLFPSFTDCDEWVDREAQAILENNLFYIAVEDNQWSKAIKLLQKEDCYGTLAGLQSRHHRRYLEGMRDILFELFPELGVYRGAWTHGTIRREDYKKEAV